MWQKEGVSDSALQEELKIFKSYLEEIPDPIPFPTFHEDPGNFTGKGSLEIRDLGAELTTKLSILAEQQNSTLFQTLVTAFAVLLFRYTGQERFLIGIPVARRDRQELESLIGRLSEVRVLSMHLSGGQSFESQLKQLQENLKHSFSFQHLSLERLIREIHPESLPGEEPFIQVLLNWRTSESRIETMDLNEARLEPIHIHRGTSRFPISITFAEGSSGIVIELEYSTDLFDQKTIQMYLRHFENILRAAVSDSAQSLEALNYMDAAELENVTKNWNKTEKKFSEESFLQAFEKTVLLYGNEPAIIYGKDVLCYADLNHRANVLGRRLLDAGILPGKRVALCLEQTPDRILSVLAAWKAGGAFLPLDPESPPKRLLLQLQDAVPDFLITTTELQNRLFAGLSGFAVVLIDRISFEEPCGNLNVEVDPDNLAYLMYTSGTTGRPKAVCVEHQSITNLLDFNREHFPLQPGDRMLQFGSYTFDFFIGELLTSLTCGAALIIDREGGDLTQVFVREKISHAILAPFVITGLKEELLPDLKMLFSSGEMCPVHLANQWRQGRRFFNAYGNTEASVYSVIWEMTDESMRTVPIGRPVSNARTYILDHHLQPVPPGVTGELYLAGRPLSRGYWHNDDLTRQKFIQHTLPMAGQERLYRTGDLARWRLDGNIEFEGRADDQIKIQGIRIEPAEPEAILRQHPAIQDCVVVPVEITPSDRRLVAYYISREKNLDPCEIQKFLTDQLPRHLVPYLFQILEFPLKGNGKLDKQLLPLPIIPKTNAEWIAPRNEIEGIVASVWSEVLKKDKVGVHDDFFGAGGHSLLGVQVILRLRDLFGKHLPMSAIFDSPTIAGLAEALSKEPSVNNP